MTTVYLHWIRCESGKSPICVGTYPVAPQEAKTKQPIKDLREAAEHYGWQATHGSQSRDLCPMCRIYEIEQAMKGEVAVVAPVEAQPLDPPDDDGPAPEATTARPAQSPAPPSVPRPRSRLIKDQPQA